MMPEPEVLKVQQLLEAARQRLILACDPKASFFRVREHTQAADEILAQAVQVLRTPVP